MYFAKSLLAASVAVAALGVAPTMAADAIAPEPTFEAPPVTTPSPLYIWSGPYAGVFLGYNWGEFSALSSSNANGIDGGLYGGYNFQFDQTVFGLEGDLGYSDVSTTLGATTAKQGVFGSVRARAGYSFDPFLLYATGGVAATRAEVSDATSSDSNTHFGWTAGAGVEAFVTENVTARLEYRYTDYQSKDFTLSSGTVSSGFDEQSVRAGIGLKF